MHVTIRPASSCIASNSFFCCWVQLYQTQTILAYSSIGLIKVNYIFWRNLRFKVNLRYLKRFKRTKAVCFFMYSVWASQSHELVRFKPKCLCLVTSLIITSDKYRLGWLTLFRLLLHNNDSVLLGLTFTSHHSDHKDSRWRLLLRICAAESGWSIIIYRVESSANSRIFDWISLTISLI